MTEQIQFSHSRVSSYVKCPAQYKYRYVDRLRVVHAPEADDALIVGNALHTGVEKGQLAMLNWYFDQYPIVDDSHINESMKLIVLLQKLRNTLTVFNGEFRHEYLIDRPDFKGFVDLIVSNPDGSVDIYDFKYSNNIDLYLKSEQLHLYKFYLEREKFKVNRIGFIFVPKITTTGKFAKLKQGKNESLIEFRRRFMAAVRESEIDVRYIPYDFQKVKSFWDDCRKLESANLFPKKPTRLCDWCSYQQYCLQGDDTMILPSTNRRQIGEVKRKTLWIYGAPFSGKTWFANKFHNPLMLNTDGNVDFVDAPFIPIRDEITVTGRLTTRKLAWAIFKETIEELEKKQNDFGTIIVDLLEDTYEHCRIYMYDKLGIEHESDNSFKAWDMVRTEFLSTMKRLLNLPYDIILISHEDLTKDLTRRTGDKVSRIAPNIQEKAALKIAGMVQLVARAVSEDDERWLTFKSSEVEFGGGRLGVRARKIPLEYDDFAMLYEEVNQDKSTTETVADKGGKRAGRRKAEEKPAEQPEQPAASDSESSGDQPPFDPDVPQEETQKEPRTRRRAESNQPPAEQPRTRRSRNSQ